MAQKASKRLPGLIIGVGRVYDGKFLPAGRPMADGINMPAGPLKSGKQLNISSVCIILCSVSRWKTMMASVLALLYVLAITHCPLEQAGFFGESRCCASSMQQEDKTASCEDGCCTLASSFYFSRQKTGCDVPLIAVSGFVLCTLAVDLAQKTASPSLIGPPPELSQTWQFSLRTALPPRAPSFVS
jgi:hypothetical protein